MARRREQYYTENVAAKFQTQQYNQLQDQIEDINEKLSHLPSISRGQRGYTKKYMFKQISNKFEDLKVELKQAGHNFRFNGNKRDFFDYSYQGHMYKIKRVLKLRFRCKNNRCPQFSRHQQQEKCRKWTTYYGLTLFSMYFDKNQVLRYDFKNYGQKCLMCGVYGSGQIIENQMNNLVELYSLIIKLVFLLSHNLNEGIELNRTQKYGKAPQKLVKATTGRTIGHLQDLCQACKDKQCLYFYRSQVLRK